MGKARHPFWLDGGYDHASVDACPYAPEHRWWTFRLGDVLLDPRNPDELMVVCRGCYVPRCGHATDDPDPCLRPRHHDEYHRYTRHAPEKVGA